MYTFRTVLPDGCIKNISLGSEYMVVYKGQASAMFETLVAHFGNVDGDELAGYVRSENGETFSFLSSNKNYIMQGGKTIERL